IMEVVLEEAAKLDISPIALALAWNLSRPGVVSPIIGPKSVKQLEDNLAALDVTHPPDTVEQVDAARAPGHPYPHDLLRMARPPGATATSLILPDIGAVISFSIFMASMTRRMSPSATVSPGLTLTLITRPVIWAVTAPAAAGEVFFAAAFGRGRAPARPLTSTSYSLASTRSLTAPSAGRPEGTWTANGFSLSYTVAMLACRTMRSA